MNTNIFSPGFEMFKFKIFHQKKVTISYTEQKTAEKFSLNVNLETFPIFPFKVSRCSQVGV